MENTRNREEEDTSRRGVNWRGLTSITVTLSFLALAATGIVLYVTPQGRVANWTGWTILGLGKEQWAAAHTTLSLLFIIASLIHVYFNWRVLVRYFLLKRHVNLKGEIAAAFIIVAVVFGGTTLGIPPFGGVAALNEQIKEHWDSQSAQAPYPHAEASTIAEFAEQTNTSLPTLLERLHQSGVETNATDSRTLADLAHEAGLTPNELFEKIADSKTQGGGGSGYGRKSVRSLCESMGISSEKAMNTLREQGFTVSMDSLIKDLAEEKGVSPSEIMAIIKNIK